MSDDVTFFDVVAKGANVCAHPDTLAEADEKAPNFMRMLRRICELHETKIQPSKFCEPGIFYATPKLRPLKSEFAMPPFEKDWLRDYMYERLLRFSLIAKRRPFGSGE